MMRVAVLCILALGILASGQENDRPEVKTKYGKLRGKTTSVKGTERNVHTFFGVPFAKPPVGSLRFAAPEPPEPWSSTREASQYSPMCLQDPRVMEMVMENMKLKQTFPPVSEDCLYLNVYTPADRTKEEKLPVMTFIHGGGLGMGAAMTFEGSALSAYENVVVVSIQYRLGLLGFYSVSSTQPREDNKKFQLRSSGDDRASGNYGFLDQVAALRWVKENIGDFGGDPDSVTIFGESAGGVSVSALVVSPLAKGLFHKAIAESGVAIMPGIVANSKREDVLVRNIVANISGCGKDVLVECLKAKSEEEIMSVSNSMELMSLPVTIDGVFFPKPVEEMLAGKEVNSVPFMIGITNQEFGFVMPLSMSITGFQEGMKREAVRELMKNLSLLRPFSSVASLLMDKYLGNETDPAEIRNRFLDLAGDLVFAFPALKVAKYHRDSGHPTYFFEFQHRPSIFKNTKPEFVKSDHGDELFFVMGRPFVESDYMSTEVFTEEEKNLSRTVMKYWANFARTGNPNGPGMAHWPLFDREEGYMEIDLVQRAAKHLKAEKFEFLANVLPQKLQEEKIDLKELMKSKN